MDIFIGILVGIAYFLIGVIFDKVLQPESAVPSLFLMIFWPVLTAAAIVIFMALFIFEIIKGICKRRG